MDDNASQKRYAARRLSPGWCGAQEVDEGWMAEWVAFGLAELERFLANDAVYREWCMRVGREP